VGAEAAPVVGPTNSVLADCVASDAVSVPVVVTGDPLTLKILGTDRATLVTPVFPTTIPFAAGVMMMPAPEVIPKSPPVDSGTMVLIVATRKGMHVEDSVDVHVFPEMSTQLFGMAPPIHDTELMVSVAVDCKLPKTAFVGKHEASNAPPGQEWPEMSMQSVESGPLMHCMVPFR